MQIAGSDSILAVHDLGVSGAWYRDVLGYELDDITPGDWRFCGAGTVTLMPGRCPSMPEAIELGDHSRRFDRLTGTRFILGHSLAKAGPGSHR